MLFGIPNFWNVASNAAFLIAAFFGIRALRRSAFTERWERAAFGITVCGVALTALGSAYYHWHPTTETLFWDRLPMTIVFMSIFAATIGERVSMKAGEKLLFPLLILGGLSVIYWRTSGDLRPYALVQFVPMIAIPILLLRSPSNSAAMWAMVGFYTLAKLLEIFDAPIGHVFSTGGHPWKHVAGAAAIVSYVKSKEGARFFAVQTTTPPCVESSKYYQ
jgi:hypothetical protein